MAAIAAASATTPNDLRRMTSQPTIVLSTPATVPTTNRTVSGGTSKGSNAATPKAANSPQPLLTTTPSASQHLPASRSQSIPSSPTSVHSSSSAIFERDIEPISFASSPLKHDPHHTSRGQAHEPVEQSVPAVLTSAVSALATTTVPAATATESSLTFSSPGRNRRSIYDDGEISVISPAGTAPAASVLGGGAMMLSGMTTPRSMSRSPSPPIVSGPAETATTTRSTSPRRPPGQPSDLTAVASSSTSTAAAAVPSSFVAPDLNATPMQSLFTSTSPTSEQVPSSSTLDNNSHTLSSPSTSSPRHESISSFDAPIPRIRSTANTSNLPTGNPIADDGLEALSIPSNRLSFISYHDLLVSTPLSAAPLSAITSGTEAPPAHTQILSSSTSSPTNRERGRASPPVTFGAGITMETVGMGSTNVGWGKEDGGEWEREGLGKGLEERLEGLLKEEREAAEAGGGGSVVSSF